MHLQSPKIMGAMPLNLAFTFSGRQKEGFCMREVHCGKRDKKLHFCQKIGSVVGRSVLKANDVLPFSSSYGKH